MDMNSTTLRCTSEKYDNDSGAMVVCETEDMAPSKPKLSRRTRKQDPNSKSTSASRSENEELFGRILDKDKKWYSTLLRGALGRWSGKRVARTPEYENSEGNRRALFNNPRCPENRCDLHENSPCHKQSLNDDKAGTAGNNIWDNQLAGGISNRCVPYAEGKTVEDRQLNVENESGSPTIHQTFGRGRHKTHVATQKVSRDAKCMSGEVLGSGTKRWKKRRKYFHSPLHKKEDLQGRRKVQSTYVSFQDDFMADMWMDGQGSTALLSPSESPLHIHADLDTDSYPIMSSPEMVDDAFTEGYTSEQGSQNDEKALDDDDRINQLFQKVNSAFGKSFEGEKVVDEQHFDGDPRKTEIQGETEHCALMGYRNKLPGEHIETIMANANLQASLDNALSMLNESTKLLNKGDSNPWACGRCSRTQSHNHSQFQQARSRTYSTGSRLAPIAEENDRPEETAINNENAGDDGSCTFSDSSEYEKFSSFIPRAGTLSCAEDMDVRMKWLVSSACNKIPRNDNISTILVRSSHRRKGLVKDLSEPQTSKKCAACEWAHGTDSNDHTSVIPNSAWRTIVTAVNTCHNMAHFHPPGSCQQQQTSASLCHTHYLQYYQRHLRRKGDLEYAHSRLSDYDDMSSSSDVTAITPGCCHFHATSLHKNYGYYRESDTDVSVASDSAFSTNGSPTPSTRDGVNTDGESIRSFSERLDSFGTSAASRNDPGTPQETNGNDLREKRARSYEDAQSFKVKSKMQSNPRYSLVSSICSSSHPLASDELCDSAVHLQGSASSRSTHLSSDSCFSSGNIFDDKEMCLINCESSRSSSEESLISEGTLCLSEYARSQQNISLFSIPSFPEVSDICSPKSNIPMTSNVANCIESLTITENVSGPVLPPHLARYTDTLSSSYDTHTLGSGSTGSTYTTLSSYTRFNTLGSGSCVSTDDTGETVIDQFKLRETLREGNNAKQFRLTRAGSEFNSTRYQPSAFHYQNLEIPFYNEPYYSQVSTQTTTHLKKDYAPNSIHQQISASMSMETCTKSCTRSRSSSMSCLHVSSIRASLIFPQSKSLPSIHLFQNEGGEHISTKHKDPVDEVKQSSTLITCAESQAKYHNLSPKYYDVDTAIASLKKSLGSCTTEEDKDIVDHKLHELAKILKRKDEVINMLHKLLLNTSAPTKRSDYNHQLNATI